MSVASNIEANTHTRSHQMPMSTPLANGKPKRIQPPAHWGQHSPLPTTQAKVPKTVTVQPAPATIKQSLKKWQFWGVAIASLLLFNAMLWQLFPIADSVLETLNLSAPFIATTDASLPTPSWLRQ